MKSGPFLGIAHVKSINYIIFISYAYKNLLLLFQLHDGSIVEVGGILQSSGSYDLVLGNMCYNS